MSPRALVLFAALAIAWGIPYLLIKVAVGELDPAMVVLARSALGGWSCCRSSCCAAR
ncbi:hypothetical protein [Naasia aerilata]|uniref:EamA domain-containing protein n=1 Tax=Naasia aerilata TaxID=1162966 RepID=A0ABM8G8K6_9MICO|nr:hypothetical protein [Naasia aerilata]BDZ44531.1 hypothetical protein GCM10025866_04400 [Naasia aerilata]